MTVTNVEKNTGELVLTITTEFDAPVERVWELWENPRQLERWWGPPTYPATMVDFHLKAGGEVNYYMTGPNGDRSNGWWRVINVGPPHSLEFEDGFSNDDGTHSDGMPTMTVRVTLTERADGGTHMIIATWFASREDMDKMIKMGMDEGMSQAVGQMDALLAASEASSTSR